MGKDKGGKGGVVVNISSIAGLGPFAAFPIYNTTKHAVIGLTRSFGVSTTYGNVVITYKGRMAFICCILSLSDAQVPEFYMSTFRNKLTVPHS
jgi:hypothetical protein